MSSPGITLTATSSDTTGAPIAGPAKLRIVLTGYGPNLPVVPGVCTIDQVVNDCPFSGAGTLSVKLWGNDVIQPPETWYCIMSFDASGNLIGAGDYQFTGTQTIDLSNAVPILNPAGGAMPYLALRPCAGAIPGNQYTAPGTVIAVIYNGVIQRPFTSASLPYDYTLTGTAGINLNFTTQSGGNVYALCVV